MEIDLNCFADTKKEECIGEKEKADREKDRLAHIYAMAEDVHLLFVGSLNCIRHKPYMEIGKKMATGKASFLCPSMSDFATGRYLHQICDAVAELHMERGILNFVIAFGCQWIILSTDSELIAEQLHKKYGINVMFYDDSHLENGDHS